MSDYSVLIIEDDDTLMRRLTDNFASNGYHVQTAADGERGLRAALDDPPDLLILDIMLPKMNGYEPCRIIRERHLDLPIIMLTAKGQEEDIVLGLNLGADDYVTKPFSIRELLARARSLLRRRQIDASELVRFGDCEIDTQAHKRFRGGVEVSLTAQEYRLLGYFIRRPGRVLTRNDIMNAVWGDSVIVTVRSIDRCVARLRSKIEPDPASPSYIHTLRDVGYRFEPKEKL